MEKTRDEPSKLRRSLRGVLSFSSCLLSLISFAATSRVYALFSRRLTIPGRWSLSRTQVGNPAGAHLKESTMNRCSLENFPHASKLQKVGHLVMEKKGTARHIRKRFCEFVACVLHSPKIVVESSRANPGFGPISTYAVLHGPLTYTSSVALLNQG
jgi:hypothetical protein